MTAGRTHPVQATAIAPEGNGTDRLRDTAVIGSSWTHLLARQLVRPLVRYVTPNELTTLRLLTGLLACGAVSIGHAATIWWGGWLWLVSAFLDRADGELARLTKRCSASGHLYDCIVDNFVNSGFFIAAGVALRHSPIPVLAFGLGLWTGTALAICGYWSEALERRQGPGSKAYGGAFGFDPDDLLFLLAPIAWLDWLAGLLVCASVGSTAMMLLTGWRLQRSLLRYDGLGVAEN